MNKKGQEGILMIIIFFIGILFVLIPMIYCLMYTLTTGSEIITIKEKWVEYHGDDAKYLVSSTDGQVFEITDAFIRWRWRWNSSELYDLLDENQTCQIKTQGWEFSLFSDYKFILEAVCN